MAQPSVLTIREAKAALNLSGPRIHQLLASGDLDGPPLTPGRKRHAPGAPRVTATSIARYLDAGRADDRGVPAKPTAEARPSTQQSVADEGPDSAGAAAQELKVRLDAMRDALRSERALNKQLLEVIEKLVGMLRSSQITADHLDDVTEAYSQALTQLLAPETAPRA